MERDLPTSWPPCMRRCQAEGGVPSLDLGPGRGPLLPAPRVSSASPPIAQGLTRVDLEPGLQSGSSLTSLTCPPQAPVAPAHGWCSAMR